MSANQIVIVEDEPDILEVISYNLKREGFDVETSMDGIQGFRLIQDISPDLVLLDIMLPGLDGLEICRRLRADPSNANTSIIIVSAKGEENDVVLGLGLGADDYIAKPFSPRELLARVKAVLRRRVSTQSTSTKSSITVDQLEIDVEKFTAFVDGEKINLTATEFRLLHFLASNRGRVFTRDQLLGQSSGNDAMVIDRNIDVHVRAIRKKLGSNQQYIETIRGVGYRFKDQN
jgi:two-component system alkaline phosphatase synthesis response regulator PhoP